MFSSLHVHFMCQKIAVESVLIEAVVYCSRACSAMALCFMMFHHAIQST